MKTILDIILLLVGFVLLIKGADYFVDGSCAVAKRLRVPSIVIGLTIVAVGTSLPELAVSTFAAVKHSNAIALGNVVGSNIFNLLMVIGIKKIHTKKRNATFAYNISTVNIFGRRYFMVWRNN